MSHQIETHGNVAHAMGDRLRLPRMYSGTVHRNLPQIFVRAAGGAGAGKGCLSLDTRARPHTGGGEGEPCGCCACGAPTNLYGSTS